MTGSVSLTLLLCEVNHVISYALTFMKEKYRIMEGRMWAAMVII